MSDQISFEQIASNQKSIDKSMSDLELAFKLAQEQIVARRIKILDMLAKEQQQDAMNLAEISKALEKVKNQHQV